MCFMPCIVYVLPFLYYHVSAGQPNKNQSRWRGNAIRSLQRRVLRGEIPPRLAQAPTAAAVVHGTRAGCYDDRRFLFGGSDPIVSEMRTILPHTQNPTLRQRAREVHVGEIKSRPIRGLI